MLVSLNWLRQYVDLGELSTDELAEKITKSGIEVDGVHYVADKSTNVVVGYVESCEQHPDADKLNLCQVNVGEETLQIICGAKNIAQGQKVAVAKPGAVLPGNFKIKKAKLRGIESFGMICSLQELGIEETFVPKEFEEGIFVFPEETEVGAPVEDLLNLNDAILEFDLTPNRSDCLSMLGVAFEVAAILDEDINLPEETVNSISEETKDYIAVNVEAKDLNPYYAAFVIRDVEIKPSPLWMRNYLTAAGIRPINNVVDITNYVLLEYGQPLHAFDYDLFNSKEILVRRAKNEEKLITLDDKERVLSEANLVITNGKEPVALAGVMGGANTEVHDATVNVLLEAAYFDGGTVRTTVKETGLRSESSTRFEKGVDPNRVYRAGLRACSLLEQYANGKVLANPVVASSFDIQDVVIKVDANRVNKRLGTDIANSEMAHIFEKLRFEFTQDGDVFSVQIPSRRGDITIFEDMLEEVARIYGYDYLPYTLPKSSTRGGLTEKQKLKREVKHYLQGAGLQETITYSLTDEASIHTFVSHDVKAKNAQPIALSLPMTEDHKYLRVSLLPELLKVVRYNEARNEHDIALYELGSVFLTEETSLTKQPEENARLAGAICGSWMNHPWQQETKHVDFFVLKGIVEGLFNQLFLDVQFKPAVVKDLHPGRTAEVIVNGSVIGFIGQVHPLYAKQHDLKETYVFDLNFDVIAEAYERQTIFAKIPRFPSIARDIAFIVSVDVHAHDIKDVIVEAGGELVTDVHIFDVYQGENLEDGKKSIAYHLTYQHPEKTLQDEDVEESYNAVIAKVNETFGAYVRS